MPLFQLDIEKRLGSEFWTNRYFMLGDTFSNTVTASEGVVNAERALHSTQVTFTRYRVSDPTSTQYVIVPLNVAGLRATQGTLLPLFNTLRFDITAITGRPSRKYYRGVLGEDDIAGDALDSDFSAFAATLAAELSTGTGVNGIIGPQEEVLTDVTIHPFVQMRQLRRSRRRRATGGIFQ